MTKFFSFLLILIFFITDSYAKENNIHNIVNGIAQMCASSIYNYDLDTVRDIINESIKTHKQIVAIKIVDITINNILYQASKKMVKSLKIKIFMRTEMI